MYCTTVSVSVTCLWVLCVLVPLATGARSFHQSIQAGYEAHPTSYWESSRRTFPRLKGPARKADDSPASVEDKNAGNFATTLLEHTFFGL